MGWLLRRDVARAQRHNGDSNLQLWLVVFTPFRFPTPEICMEAPRAVATVRRP